MRLRPVTLLPMYAATLACIVLLPLASATADELKLPNAKEAKCIRTLMDLFEEEPTVRRSRDGGLQSIQLRGRPHKANGTMTLHFDREGHVERITGNAVGITNEQFKLFLPLRHLRVLRLHHNFCPGSREVQSKICDGAGIAHLSKLPKLEEIQLPGSRFDNDGLAAAGKLKQLKSLGIWHVNVSNDGFAALRGHPSLEAIKVAPMWSDRISDATLEHLSHCPKLKNIYLNEAYVTYDQGLKHLIRLKGTLTILDLKHSVVDPKDLEKLRGQMPQTKILHSGVPAVGKLILTNFKGAKNKLSRWVPKEILQLYVDAAKDSTR